MADFLKFVGGAIASAAILAVLAGLAIDQLVKRDQNKIEHNRRATDQKEVTGEEIHTGARSA